jgi:Xaa-Pro aminopeptidase
MGKLRHRCIDMLVEGNTPRQVLELCRSIIVERGLQTTGVGRIGHGVGLEATEYPSIASEEDVVFRSGMTLTCNPNFVRDFGFINGEDVWAVTTGAPDLLSAPMASPTEIPIIAVR